MASGSLLLLQLLLISLLASSLARVSTVQTPANDEEGHCCLPVKWHSKMLKTNAKKLLFIQTGDKETETVEPMTLDIFVNHRRPRFQIRRAGGNSLVFWRGHMWLFWAAARWPKHLNAVPKNFKPSGGFAPLFFRCLTRRNGFEKMNETHYQMVEPVPTPEGRRLNLRTITDVFVVPAPSDTPAVIKDRRRHTCLLTGFRVTSSYVRLADNRGPAVVIDTDGYTAQSEPRYGWPDKSLTQRARSYVAYYRSLLRSGRITVSRPRSTVVPPPTSGSSSALLRAPVVLF